MAISLVFHCGFVLSDKLVIDAIIGTPSVLDETAIQLFCLPSPGETDCTGFSNGSAIATDGERDSTAAKPDNCVLWYLSAW
jgi:hypothetical protein